MLFHRISDWEDAYANSDNIARGHSWPDAWAEPASSYRKELASLGQAKLDIVYGKRKRNVLDVFMPKGPAKGLAIFIHGGYWLALDKTFWSHLARGPVENGIAVAIPSYTLCPEARISDVTNEVAIAIETVASLIPGPLFLTGHSAGGHLVSRMISGTSPLCEATRARIRNTVSISGIHDLRPLMRTSMNAALRIDDAEALTESPALLAPMRGARIICWVGGAERSEFVRQSGLLANIWAGLGAETIFYEEPDRHHFNVIDGLTDPRHVLVKTLLVDADVDSNRATA